MPEPVVRVLVKSLAMFLSLTSKVLSLVFVSNADLTKLHFLNNRNGDSGRTGSSNEGRRRCTIQYYKKDLVHNAILFSSFLRQLPSSTVYIPKSIMTRFVPIFLIGKRPKKL